MTGRARPRPAPAFDVIGAIEACYTEHEDDARWLAGLVAHLRPLGGGGVLALVLGRTQDGLPRVDEEQRTGPLGEVRARMVRVLSPEVAAELTCELLSPSPPIRHVLRARGPGGLIPADLARVHLRRAGLDDAVVICATVPGGQAALALGQLRGGEAFAPMTLHQLERLSAHLCSALRLRRALADAAAPDAILDASGRLLEATEEAARRPARAGLAEAVRRVERARGRMRWVDPGGALELWQGLVAGTWSLVDHCDADGKRYVLARRNEAGVRDPRALTPRERAVITIVAMGHQNKYAAYLLGLTPSAVARHLGAGQRKLGVSSRTELIRRFGPLLRLAPPPQGARRRAGRAP